MLTYLSDAYAVFTKFYEEQAVETFVHPNTSDPRRRARLRWRRSRMEAKTAPAPRETSAVPGTPLSGTPADQQRIDVFWRARLAGNGVGKPFSWTGPARLGS
jgi:hypothetical protein